MDRIATSTIRWSDEDWIAIEQIKSENIGAINVTDCIRIALLAYVANNEQSSISVIISRLDNLEQSVAELKETLTP